MVVRIHFVAQAPPGARSVSNARRKGRNKYIRPTETAPHLDSTKIRSSQAAGEDGQVRLDSGRTCNRRASLPDFDSTPALEITSTAKPRTATQIAAQAKAQAEAAKLRLADEQRRQAKRDGLVSRRDIQTAELTRLRKEGSAPAPP
jgi:hypothetical protein